MHVELAGARDVCGFSGFCKKVCAGGGTGFCRSPSFPFLSFVSFITLFRYFVVVHSFAIGHDFAYVSLRGWQGVWDSFV